MMLSKEDLKAIEQLMRNVVEENNEVLRSEMSDMKAELRSEMSDMKAELRSEMSDMKTELRSEMSGMKTELRSEMTDVQTGLREEFRREMSELKRDIEKTIEVKIEESEGFLLDEMERYYNMTKKDLLNLEEKVDRIDRYYSIRRLEDEERDLKLQLHQEAIDDIKERLAM